MDRGGVRERMGRISTAEPTKAMRLQFPAEQARFSDLYSYVPAEDRYLCAA